MCACVHYSQTTRKRFSFKQTNSFVFRCQWNGRSFCIWKIKGVVDLKLNWKDVFTMSNDWRKDWTKWRKEKRLSHCNCFKWKLLKTKAEKFGVTNKRKLLPHKGHHVWRWIGHFLMRSVDSKTIQNQFSIYGVDENRCRWLSTIFFNLTN